MTICLGVGLDVEVGLLVRLEVRVPCRGFLGGCLDLEEELFWSEDGDLRFFEILLWGVEAGSVRVSSLLGSVSSASVGAAASGFLVAFAIAFSCSLFWGGGASDLLVLDFAAPSLGGMIYNMGVGIGYMEKDLSIHQTTGPPSLHVDWRLFGCFAEHGRQFTTYIMVLVEELN